MGNIRPWQADPPVILEPRPPPGPSQMSNMEVGLSQNASLPPLEQVLSQVPTPMPKADDDSISILPSSLRPKTQQRNTVAGEDSDSNSDSNSKRYRHKSRG